MAREGRHRLSIDIPIELYKEIKRLAKIRNITITRWIIRASFARVRLENRDPSD